MSTIVGSFKKTWLVVGILALGFASLSMAGASALSVSDPITTPTPTQMGIDRLEMIWARERAVYNKLGRFFNIVDQYKPRWQKLINKAKANGKDVSTLQSALNNFSEAVAQAKPIIHAAYGIFSTHPGFDGNGNVTDQGQALTTVKEVGEKFKEIHLLLSDSVKALREAVWAFRQANAPTGKPVPDQSGG
jgi:hypothetical protein